MIYFILEKRKEFVLDGHATEISCTVVIAISIHYQNVSIACQWETIALCQQILISETAKFKIFL